MQSVHFARLVVAWSAALMLSVIVARAETSTRPITASGSFRCPSEVQYVRTDGTAVVDFMGVFPAGTVSASVLLSPFVSKDEEIGDVWIAAAGAGSAPKSPASGYSLQGPRFLLPLSADDLTEGVKYTGKVTLLVDQIAPVVCSIDLVMPKVNRADLVTDTPTLTRTVTLPAVGRTAQAELSFRLFEKTRRRRIDGIAAALDGPSQSPQGTFDPGQFIDFYVNGIAATNFMGGITAASPSDWDASKPLGIGPGEQLDITLQLHDLAAGQYAFTLNVNGSNGAAQGAKIDVKVNVRQNIAWAIAAILAALTVSYVISKGIVNWRDRSRLRRRIRELELERFDEFRGLPSVVFLRAVLDQSRQLLDNQWLLPPPPSILDYLARAERVECVLRSFGRLIRTLEDSECIGSVRYFYEHDMRQIMHEIGPQPLDQKTTDGILDDFAKIQARLADPLEWYWTKLRARADQLVQLTRQVQNDFGDPHVGDAHVGKVVDALIKKLQSPPNDKMPAIDEVSNISAVYWIVDLLYYRRPFRADILPLVEHFTAENPGFTHAPGASPKAPATVYVTKTFRYADEMAWKRIKAAVGKGKVLLFRRDSADPLEALSPVRYELRFDDPALATSYFVQNILTYDWTLAVTEPAGTLKRHGLRFTVDSRTKTWEVRTDEPRITQYAPFPGEITVSVKIRWHVAGSDATHELDAIQLPVESVGPNTELSLINAISASEVLLMLLIAAAALLTSIPALYLAKPTFGSFEDYVAILAWAIGIDQGKNLIQLMKTYSSEGATSPVQSVEATMAAKTAPGSVKSAPSDK